VSRAKKIIAGIYSAAAEKLYDPLVVRGTFRALGGDLNALVLAQGQRALELARGGPILDLPVGTGFFTQEMSKRYEGLVVGSDIAWGMVREADKRGVTVVQADAHRLPYPDGAFKVVLCSNGLQVMPGLDETLQELERVLADDGTLLASVVNLPMIPSDHVPTMFMSRRTLMEHVTGAGFGAISAQLVRLATVIEARKH
jgi:ubiquinone/menaquinone biosynthesis C-methylase UbiE